MAVASAGLCKSAPHADNHANIPPLSFFTGLVAEMIQTTGDIGTQWILELFNGIVKEGCIPEDWKSSVGSNGVWIL